MSRHLSHFLLAMILCAAGAKAFSSNLKGLDSTGPNKDYAGKMMLYGQLVGDWDIDYTAFNSDGSKLVLTKGEWHFGWALDGRAVEDVWIVPGPNQPRVAGAPKGEWGTTIRYYDPKID